MAEKIEIHPKKSITVVVAGRSGAGKSTLLNNLFGTSFPTGLSADPVTKEPTIDEKLIKEEIKHGVTVRIIDTVGLHRKEEMKSKQLKDLSKFIEEHGEVDLVLYCVPIAPSHRFDESNPAIMKALQDAFSKDVWKHCVLIFTFSNHAWDRCSDEGENQEIVIGKYKKYVTEYAEKFNTELKDLGVHEVDVKTIFDLKPASQLPNAMLIVPAGNKEQDQVLPGCESLFDSTGDNTYTWIDVLVSIILLANPESSVGLAQFKYGEEIVEKVLEAYGIVISAVAGIAIALSVKAGAVKCGILGAKVGAIGGIPGIVVGALVGAIIGGGTAGIYQVVKKKK